MELGTSPRETLYQLELANDASGRDLRLPYSFPRETLLNIGT